MTTNAATIAKQRAVLREVDLKLMSVAFDVESNEAAVLVGRARAEIRAAEQLLGAATRERCDPPATAGYVQQRLVEGGLRLAAGSPTMLTDEFARYQADQARASCS